MRKGAILAVVLLLVPPCLAQTGGEPSDTMHFGRCTVSLDKSKLGPGWTDPATLVRNPQPLHVATTVCATCRPILAVGAFATDGAESAGETVEQHATSLLADRERTEHWLTAVPEWKRPPNNLCQFVDRAIADGRTIGGLPFRGAHAMERCTVGQNTVTLASQLLYEAVGEGCRFIAIVIQRVPGKLTDQDSAAAEEPLGALQWSFGK